MKILGNSRFAPLLVALSLGTMLAVPAIASAAQAPINLRTAQSFAVLAGSTITNTGPTTINGSAGGDIGLFSGTDFPGQSDVTQSGDIHIADAEANLAKTHLGYAYDEAAQALPETLIATELGGQTLKPGVYYSESGTFLLTGTLTLDAEGDPNAVFIFKTVSTLITESNSTVNMINSARFCRVFWKVGSSATLGTGSHFVGHIFAQESIAAQTGAVIQGQLLARTGAVTLDTNTITNGLCATISSETETGGKLPATSTPWYNMLLAGAVFAMLGAAGLWATTRRIHE